MKVGQLFEILMKFPSDWEIRLDDNDGTTIAPPGVGLRKDCWILWSDCTLDPPEPTHHVGDASVGVNGIGIGSEQAKM